MSVFGDYSRYYDLLYKDKDYAGEVTYINGLIHKYEPSAKKILDLGCGTGRHAFLLAEKGYSVHGVDISEGMLAVANKRADEKRLTFSLGDVRTIRLDQSFDVVISLFHVMSYQYSNKDLQRAFATACSHLNKGGVFIFDCWYGPAVLSQRPTQRIKILKNEIIEVTRIADPVMHINENIVDVHYQVFIRDKNSGSVKEIKEIHRMRYLFKPELDFMLEQAGFAVKGFFELMTGREPGENTWNVCIVGRKN